MSSHERFDAILFDLFGTLVRYSSSRTEQGYPETHALLRREGVALAYPAFLDAWAQASAELDAWSRATEREFSMDDVASRFLARVAPERSAPPLREAVWRSYVAEWEKGVSTIQGVPELLAALSARFELALVTNTHHAALALRQLDAIGVRDRFAAIVTSIDHGRPKPHPSIFEAALGRLGTSRERALFIGDSFDADYQGATRAGLHALLIDPERASPAPREHTIASVLEVRERVD